MITARHEKGKVVITVGATKEIIDLQEAQRLHQELSVAMFGCREFDLKGKGLRVG